MRLAAVDRPDALEPSGVTAGTATPDDAGHVDSGVSTSDAGLGAVARDAGHLDDAGNE